MNIENVKSRGVNVLEAWNLLSDKRNSSSQFLPLLDSSNSSNSMTCQPSILKHTEAQMMSLLL